MIDRKMSNVQTFQIPKSKFEVTAGQLKIYEKISDHGNSISTHFCANCGTAIFRTGGAPQVKDLIGLRAGILDDQTLLNEQLPKIEVYVEQRPKWINQIPTATQLNGKYEILEHGAAG